MEAEIDKVLITENEINKRVKELAHTLDEFYDSKQLVLLGILKGSYHFLSDLIKNNKRSREYIRDTIKGIKQWHGHFRHALNHEQSVHTYLYFAKKRYAKIIEILPYGVFQSFYNKMYEIYETFKPITSTIYPINIPWEYGDYCIHFATLSSEERLKLCKEIDRYNQKVQDTHISEPKYYYKVSKKYKY